MIGIQVTSGQKTIQDLQCWEQYLTRKHIKTFVVRTPQLTFELWREMIPRDKEKKGLEQKPLKPMEYNPKFVVPQPENVSPTITFRNGSIMVFKSNGTQASWKG